MLIYLYFQVKHLAVKGLKLFLESMLKYVMSTLKSQNWNVLTGHCLINFQVIHQLSLGNVPCTPYSPIRGGNSSSSLVFPKMPVSIHHVDGYTVTWAIPLCFCDSTEITAQDLHSLITVPVSSPQCSEWALLGDIQAHLFLIKGMKAFPSITLSQRYLLIHIHTLGAIPLELIATCLLFTALWALYLPTITDHFLTWLQRTFSLP